MVKAGTKLGSQIICVDFLLSCKGIFMHEYKFDCNISITKHSKYHPKNVNLAQIRPKGSPEKL